MSKPGLKTFVGFKGVCAFAEIDRVQFVLLAKNERQLTALWSHIMASVPLDPNGLKKAILIESTLLPAKDQSGQSGQSRPTTP